MEVCVLRIITFKLAVRSSDASDYSVDIGIFGDVKLHQLNGGSNTSLL